MRSCLRTLALCWLTTGCVAGSTGAEAPPTDVTYFKPSWSSLKKHALPQWIRDDKFGIFAHFCPSSGAMPEPLPGVAADWYARLMYLRDHPAFAYHQRVWGDQKEFGYKDLVQRFTAEKFSADEWIELFLDAGARFVVPVAEHHDHFAMWDSELTEWCAAKKGPKRDIIGELEQAARGRGMRFGLSNHRARGLTFYTYDEGFDTVDPEGAGLYTEIGEGKYWTWNEALADWEARLVELTDKYHPDMLWFDYGWAQPQFDPYKRSFIAYYYNQALARNQEVTVTYKGQHLPWGVGLYDIERGRMTEAAPFFWQTDTTVATDTWAYKAGIELYTVKEELEQLVDIVSKNGALLLNIAPRGDGSIPEDQQELLRGMGAWLKVHGEAIYKTVPWQVAEEGDVRFTRRGRHLYAHFLNVPDGELEIANLGTSRMGGLTIRAASLLGSDDVVTWRQGEAGMALDLPESVAGNPIPVVRFELTGQGCINFLPTLTHHPAGYAVEAVGTVVNFSDETLEDRAGRAYLFEGRTGLGHHVQLNLLPGAEQKVHFEHSDQATYGARASVVPGDRPVVQLSFGFGKTRSPEKHVLLPGLGLQGTWRFSATDDTMLADISLDDTAWRTVNLPGHWPAEDEGIGWCRNTFLLPKELEAVPLKLTMGVVHPWAEIYLNGKKIGESDISRFEHPGGYQPSVHRLDAAQLRYGTKNVLALRMKPDPNRKRFEVGLPLPQIAVADGVE